MNRAWLLGLVAVVSCGEHDAAGPRMPAYSISDGVHNDGNEHFFFLPPLVPSPAHGGVSDGSLSPTVSVCEWNGVACATLVATFTTSSGTGSEMIRYDSISEHYIVNWHTDRCVTGPCELNPARTYRLRVQVGRIELGFADLDVVSNGAQLRNVQTTEYIGLVGGRTLPVKFRIERGALDEMESNTWASRADMITPRFGHRVAAAGGLLYVIGGVDAGGHILRTMEAYDPATDTWSARSSMSAGRFSMSVTVHAGRIYVVGGAALTFLSTLEIYDPISDSWTTGAPMPLPRYEVVGGFVNGILYAIGGYNNTSAGGYLTAVEAYTPGTNSWTANNLHAYMPTPRYALGMAEIGGLLYAVGGENLSGFTSANEEFNPALESWSVRAPMPTARFAVNVAAVDGRMYVFGGHTTSGSTSVVEAYDPSSDTWATLAPMPEPRESAGAAAIDGIIYVPGGRNNGVLLGTMVAYRP